MMESLIVAVVVLASIVWVVHRIYKSFNRETPCNGCCANCCGPPEVLRSDGAGVAAEEKEHDRKSDA